MPSLIFQRRPDVPIVTALKPTALGARRRRGLVLIAAMACLAVVVLLCGILLNISLTEQKQSRMAEWRLQAEWLAESAIERAAARLAESADYAGETWEISAEQLGNTGQAVVLIEVERGDGQPVVYSVRVRADYARDSTRISRYSKVAKVELNLNSLETGS